MVELSSQSSEEEETNFVSLEETNFVLHAIELHIHVEISKFSEFKIPKNNKRETTVEKKDILEHLALNCPHNLLFFSLLKKEEQTFFSLLKM